MARRVTNRRLTVTVIAVIVVSVLLFSRLVVLQVVQAKDLAKVARDFRSQSYVQEARRGSILDAKGTLLALSTPRYNVRADQWDLQNYVQYDEDKNIVAVGPQAAAAQLAPLLGMDPSRLGGTMIALEGSYDRWKLIAADLSGEEWARIEALGIHGIYPERFMSRQYPNGNLAGNVLGYVGQTKDDPTAQGRAGIESEMNTVLAGRNGSMTVEVGPNGTVFPQSERDEVPAQDGRDVVLTIDGDLQQYTQQVLDDTVAKYGASWGSAVILEIGTGRILTLADSATPDPSRIGEDSGNWGVRAVQSIVEPGSIGKLVTFAAAMDQGVASPLDLVEVSSTRTMPNGETFKDAEGHATEYMTYAGALSMSYNTAIVQLGDKISDATRYNYMQKFGLGKLTGVDLPGEEAGILAPYHKWDKRQRYTTMFGQGVAMTTLQMAQMVSVFGQDGVLNTPHIVDGYYDENGVYVPTVMGESTQVVSPETARTMLTYMQGVSDNRFMGNLAQVPGYNVAGKTGTAQAPGPSGALTDIVGTFVGLVPAENPVIAMAVTAYFPGGGESHMGTLPVFTKAAEFAMRQMKVSPSKVPLAKFPWYQSEM